eukprot:2692898-Amphidinium_carterae.3
MVDEQQDAEVLPEDLVAEVLGCNACGTLFVVDCVCARSSILKSAHKVQEAFDLFATGSPVERLLGIARCMGRRFDRDRAAELLRDQGSAIWET